MSSLDELKKKQVIKPEVKERYSELDDIDRIIQERMKHQKPVEQPMAPPVKSVPPLESIRTPVEAVKSSDTEFTEEDSKNFIDRKLKGYKEKKIRLRRREKNAEKNKELDSVQKMRMIVIAGAVLGLVFIGMIRPYITQSAVYTIIIIMGMMVFFPVGMIAGWMVFDPVMRCKIMRRMTKKNYGIFGFVGKGMKAVLKIKNFDDGLIWREKACWVITKDKLIQMTKDGNQVVGSEKAIDPKSVITLVDTVPMIFVDLDSMEPLQLHMEGREPVYPLEIGATLKAWEDNQRAKMMALRKASDIILIIVAVAAAGALVVALVTYQKVDALSKQITTLQGMLTNMSLGIPP